MPIECSRPLCSATVFSCIAAASLVDDFVKLVPRRVSYSPREFVELDLEEEARITLEPYRVVDGRKFEFFVVGAPSGGAAQLATILNAPLLPCNILTPVERRSHGSPDDIDSYLGEALEISKSLAKRLGEYVDVLIHYDPIHDRGWVCRNLTIRLHLKKLPKTYRNFILEHAARDAKLVILDVAHPWLQFRVDEALYVQVGGADDLEDWEYVSRSERIEPYLEALEVERYPWVNEVLERCERIRLPESEWGVRKEFVEDAKKFAEENGLEPIVIEINDFYETMVLGTVAYLTNYESFSGIVVENYKQSSSTTPLKLGYLPLWSVFTTRRSLTYVEKILEKLSSSHPIEEIIYVTVPTGYREQGSKWPDSTYLREWLEMFQRFAKKIVSIPSEVRVGTSTRTLDVMNEIYRSAWSLGEGRALHRIEKPILDVDALKSMLTLVS